MNQQLVKINIFCRGIISIFIYLFISCMCVCELSVFILILYNFCFIWYFPKLTHNLNTYIYTYIFFYNKYMYYSLKIQLLKILTWKKKSFFSWVLKFSYLTSFHKSANKEFIFLLTISSQASSMYINWQL